MKTLGAFHQTFYNREAFKFSFSQFRKHFPNSPYFILSDGGDDFSSYIDDKTFFLRSDMRNYGGGLKGEEIFKDPSNDYLWIDWFNRIKMACEICRTDYIMMMEDDVLITNSFVIDSDFDICGPMINKITEDAINFIESQIGRKISGFYGFGGGSILNCKTYLESFDMIIENFNKFHKTISKNYTDGSALSGDSNTMIHLYLVGKDYVDSPWMGREIIHPFKEKYSSDELPQNRI
jgi:hypothetical protein